MRCWPHRSAHRGESSKEDHGTRARRARLRVQEQQRRHVTQLQTAVTTWEPYQGRDHWLQDGAPPDGVRVDEVRG